jgi:uncharacterized protein (TIGR03032 family)
MATETASPPDRAAASSSTRLVQYEHSRDFPGLLEQLGITLLVSTYQAGKVLVIGEREGKLDVQFHSFEQPMGLAVSPRMLAVGTRQAVWFLAAQPAEKGLLEGYNGGFLARQAHCTGPIRCHDLAWCSGQLWVVNTLFSCLCTLEAGYNFVPRWKPPFISELAAEDRCHLNGLAADGQRPCYVTVLGRCNDKEGWRANKVRGGCLLEVPSGNVIVEGLSMPHSPRLYEGRLWVLNSGWGHLSLVEIAQGQVQAVAAMPGYTRGLAFFGPYAFVGLSKIRETNIFGGLPIGEWHDQLICGVGVVEWRTGRTVATFIIRSGVDEIYDVQVVPLRRLALSGPHAEEDGAPVVWIAPPMTGQR